MSSAPSQKVLRAVMEERPPVAAGEWRGRDRVPPSSPRPDAVQFHLLQDTGTQQRRALEMRPLRHVLILADESAHWKVAGLGQLERLVLCLEEFAASERQPLSVCISWNASILPNERWMPDEARFARLDLTQCDSLEENGTIDLVLSTRLFLYRTSLPQLRAALPDETSPRSHHEAVSWESRLQQISQRLGSGAGRKGTENPWQFLSRRQDIAACERRFLAQGGKSQDGLVSRHLNRPLSRAVSRWLLKLPLRPTAWSLMIFVLPLLACVFFLRGNPAGFVIGCAIFQLYSILDGCDGEIARSKFLQSESGRRLDSLCDLLGNVLLALSLGIGLGRQAFEAGGNGWLYLIEGIVAAVLILLSEGIVFTRRSRPETELIATKWNGALYQRHHEFIERSGLLLLGEKFAWWVVQLTKRDMAMLGFLALASLGWTQWILHLQVIVSGISSALAGNAFLRPAPAVLSEEAG